VSEHTHCRWQLDKGSWISNDVKDENRSVWVLESDYLNMKESLEAENARLKAEVERLTKAGDNLEQVLTEISYSYRAGNASHEWRAAKKGVQS
jgi:predicted RNase H-like nuclease (RuvC/YqgF family)